MGSGARAPQTVCVTIELAWEASVEMPKEQARDPGHRTAAWEGVCDEKFVLMKVTLAQLPSPGE